MIKISLNLPIAVPIFKLAYSLDGKWHYISVYPTLQFLYSHHVQGEYISKEVKHILDNFADSATYCAKFLAAAEHIDRTGSLDTFFQTQCANCSVPFDYCPVSLGLLNSLT